MWALDLGTTNTLLTRWDSGTDRPELIELPRLCRGVEREDALGASRAVPSAVHVLDRPGFWARVGQAVPLARNVFLGKLAEIGRPALELNAVRQRPNFVPTFKRALGTSPLLPLARSARRSWSAREIARVFLRELFAEAAAATGERIRDLVMTSPVEAFESYRAELVAACKRLGVRRVRFLDEPVAAALGYSLGLTRSRRALVVDFGGGTLHLALVRLDPAGVAAGACEVLAKAGRDIGGNLVDRWLLEEFCRRLEFSLDADADEEARLWQRLMLADACRVKEAVYFEEHATFELAPPEGGLAPTRSLEFGRDDLSAILTARGLYSELEGGLAEILSQAPGAEVDDVLMVGGSTLLPGVYRLFEERFGRDRVRAWQPFEAVANGGAVFAAGRMEPADFIVHDYALLTYGLTDKKPEHAVLVPRGTRFPTPPDLWKRQLVPTCSLGEPESVFKLVICEIGAPGGKRAFAWDEDGRVHRMDGAGPLVVKLNETNPALGYLDPPHSPRDSRPRLEVAFGVNAERWLCATVFDLRTKKHLMEGEPVVRLV